MIARPRDQRGAAPPAPRFAPVRDRARRRPHARAAAGDRDAQPHPGRPGARRARRAREAPAGDPEPGQRHRPVHGQDRHADRGQARARPRRSGSTATTRPRRPRRSSSPTSTATSRPASRTRSTRRSSPGTPAPADLASYRKLAELPYDFTRRLLSVVVQRTGEPPLLVTKGAPGGGHRAARASVREDHAARPIDAAEHERLATLVDGASADGFRLVAVGSRALAPRSSALAAGRHGGRPRRRGPARARPRLRGRDPLQRSAQGGRRRRRSRELARQGVALKVVTGDNELVARHVAGAGRPGRRGRAHRRGDAQRSRHPALVARAKRHDDLRARRPGPEAPGDPGAARRRRGRRLPRRRHQRRAGAPRGRRRDQRRQRDRRGALGGRHHPARAEPRGDPARA